MQFDPTVSIEGAATALGVVGAAVGYLLNLARGWRNERRTKLYLGTKMVILDILERYISTGISEEELWREYASPELAARRKYYKAWSPSKLKPLEFEREIRQLQLDHLIDLAGRDHYRVRVDPVNKYDLDKQTEAALAARVAGSIDHDLLRAAAVRALESPETKYERQQAIRTLLSLADDDSVKVVIAQLSSPDASVALAAAEVLSTYARRVPVSVVAANTSGSPPSNSTQQLSRPGVGPAAELP